MEPLSTTLSSEALHSHGPRRSALQAGLKGSHGEGTGSTGVKPGVSSSVTFETDDPILCKACRHEITSVASMIAVNGSHGHRFTNPAGIAYRLGCFSAAEGCLVYGQPTLDFTWFGGFAWNLAFCSRCYLHLGWHYQSSGKSFFGLILDNLVERTVTH